MRIPIALIAATLLVGTAAYARVGGGEIVYPVKHIGNVTFSHETHVETMGFTCTECHPFIFESREKHKTLQMSHKRQGQSCGACHNAERAFDLKSNCYVCHTKEVR